MTAPTNATALLVLWDVDHTLLENGGISKEVYAAAFAELTGRPAEHLPRTNGRTDPAVLADLLDAHGIAATDVAAERMLPALATAMASKAELLRARGSALPGAAAALAALAAVPGVVQAPLTGNIRPNALVKLAAFGLDTYLDFDAGSYGSDHSVRAELVGIAQRRAAARYGVTFDADNTVLVGDTWRDVRAGRDGGARVVAVATGTDSIDRLREAGADAVRPDLRDTGAFLAALADLTGPAGLDPPLDSVRD